MSSILSKELNSGTVKEFIAKKIRGAAKKRNRDDTVVITVIA